MHAQLPSLTSLPRAVLYLAVVGGSLTLLVACGDDDDASNQADSAVAADASKDTGDSADSDAQVQADATGPDDTSETDSDITAADTTPEVSDAVDAADTDLADSADVPTGSTFACGMQLQCPQTQACVVTGSPGCVGPPPDPATGMCAPDCQSVRCGPAGPICLCSGHACLELPSGCSDCDCALASAPDEACTCLVTDGQLALSCPSTEALPSCQDVEASYAALLGGDAATCASAEDCQVLNGHCGLGLGGCYHGVNGDLTQGELDSLAAYWVAANCDEGAPVCDCPDVPSVRCDAGGCLLQAGAVD